jgi:hypothetical protein
MAFVKKLLVAQVFNKFLVIQYCVHKSWPIIPILNQRDIMNTILQQVLCFWTLSIVLSIYFKNPSCFYFKTQRFGY